MGVLLCGCGPGHEWSPSLLLRLQGSGDLRGSARLAHTTATQHLMTTPAARKSGPRPIHQLLLLLPYLPTTYLQQRLLDHHGRHHLPSSSASHGGRRYCRTLFLRSFLRRHPEWHDVSMVYARQAIRLASDEEGGLARRPALVVMSQVTTRPRQTLEMRPLRGRFTKRKAFKAPCRYLGRSAGAFAGCQWPIRKRPCDPIAGIQRRAGTELVVTIQSYCRRRAGSP